MFRIFTKWWDIKICMHNWSIIQLEVGIMCEGSNQRSTQYIFRQYQLVFLFSSHNCLYTRWKWFTMQRARLLKPEKYLKRNSGISLAFVVNIVIMQTSRMLNKKNFSIGRKGVGSNLLCNLTFSNSICAEKIIIS